MKGRRNRLEDVFTRASRGAPDKCWEWTGARTSKGYGAMRLNGRTEPAHRLAYESAHGPIPHGLCVLHRCDNPPCVNPAHLFLGTRGDNNRDAASKGRTRSGSQHPGAKLTEDDVRAIRARSAAGELGTELARAFGVTPQLISYIIRGRIWKSA